MFEVDTGKRRDRTEYPVVALRELILNALIHRDTVSILIQRR